MKYTGLFLLLLLALSTTVHAQEEAPGNYQAITAENLDQLIEIASFNCPGDMLYSAITSIHNNTVAYYCVFDESGDYDRIITIYSLETDEVLWQLPAPSTLANFHLVSDDMIILDMQSQIQVVTSADEMPVFTVEGIISIQLSPDNQLLTLAVGNYSAGNIEVYRLPDLEKLDQEFDYEGVPTIGLSASEHGLLAIGEGLTRIRVYEIGSGNIIMDRPGTEFEHEYPYEPFDNFIFSPGADRLLVGECTVIQMGCFGIGLTLFEIESGTILQTQSFELETSNFVGFTDENTLLIADGCYNVLSTLTLDDLSATPLPVEIEQTCLQRASAVSINQDGTLISARDYSETETIYRIFGIPH